MVSKFFFFNLFFGIMKQYKIKKYLKHNYFPSINKLLLRKNTYDVLGRFILQDKKIIFVSERVHIFQTKELKIGYDLEFFSPYLSFIFFIVFLLIYFLSVLKILVLNVYT